MGICSGIPISSPIDASFFIRGLDDGEASQFGLGEIDTLTGGSEDDFCLLGDETHSPSAQPQVAQRLRSPWLAGLTPDGVFFQQPQTLPPSLCPFRSNREELSPFYLLCGGSHLAPLKC